jgi:cytochrome c-type biogenesis protein CcmH
MAELARRWGAWFAMALILGAALFVGTVSQTGPLTNADRLTNIARTIKCPVCSGESVAESNAQISQEIRKDIGQRIAKGESDQQIRDAYAAQYGEYILLTPSASGVTGLVWVLPVVLLVVALAGLGVAFSRWRVRGEVHASAADRALVADALGGLPVGEPSVDPEMGEGR